ncbi:hypothetical protein C478_10543 [Natrinema thermotolerans DSM 11552]|nr:hypothetical protein C478_10543 [Natrinema thermotolerans DSM 11552]
MFIGMDKGNVRNSDPNDIADELAQIGLHTEREAKAHVYFSIMDPPKQDAETVFGIPEAELNEELENAEAKFTVADMTIDVLNDERTSGKKVTMFANVGLLSEDEAKAYVHSDRLDDSNLMEYLGESMSRIEQRNERAQEKIKRAYRLTDFRDEYKGVQIS